MTPDEALEILLSPLPPFLDAVTMPSDEWKAFCAQTREAMRVWSTRPPLDDGGLEA